MDLTERAQEKYLMAEVRKELGRYWKAIRAVEIDGAVTFEAMKSAGGKRLVMTGIIKEAGNDSDNGKP